MWFTVEALKEEVSSDGWGDKKMFEHLGYLGCCLSPLIQIRLWRVRRTPSGRRLYGAWAKKRQVEALKAKGGISSSEASGIRIELNKLDTMTLWIEAHAEAGLVRDMAPLLEADVRELVEEAGRRVEAMQQLREESISTQIGELQEQQLGRKS